MFITAKNTRKANGHTTAVDTTAMGISPRFNTTNGTNRCTIVVVAAEIARSQWLRLDCIMAAIAITREVPQIPTKTAAVTAFPMTTKVSIISSFTPFPVLPLGLAFPHPPGQLQLVFLEMPARMPGKDLTRRLSR